MRLLITNIKQLVQAETSVREVVKGSDMKNLPIVENAFLLIENGRIADFGKMNCLKECVADRIIDAKGKLVLPSFCDSHTHIVYAGSRENEFIDKINGLSYEEIAKRGGGIINSSILLHKTSEEELYKQAMERINEMISMGTGAVEIKSGYGLSTQDELKMLRVIKRIKENSPIKVKSTFLGAHAVPLEYKGRQGEYVDLIINEMIPAVAKENLAHYIDVFCDKGFFTVEETEKMLVAGAKYGMIPKIHANELAKSGGIEIGVKHNALSVDHLEFTEEEQILTLKNSNTMPTILPGAAFFLEMEYPPVRKMMDSGLPVALASDYNPGSSPSGNMKFILSLATIKMKMTPEEAINAAIINGAYAMGESKEYGSIAKGKVANVYITKEIPSYNFLPYAYTSDIIETVILNGEVIE